MPIRGEKRESSTPVEKYLTWKGGEKDGKFVYRDKEKEMNVDYDLKEFILIKTGYTVKGFSSAHKNGFWSNEIDYFDEELTVQVFNNGIFKKGLYKEIKADLAPAGAKLHIALTVISEGEVVQFFLKGKAYYAFSELIKKVDQTQSKIKFVKAEKQTDAAQPYMLPIFDVGSDIKNKEGQQAAEVAQQLKDYRESLKGGGKEVVDVMDDDLGEDLPFN